MKEASVGEYVLFGNYVQDKDLTNGKEPIEWLVLEEENDALLLISRYALDCQPYDSKYSSVTWKICSLRTWLNGTFLKAAFNSDEQAMIPTVTVSTDPGEETNDKVFLLCIQEVNTYFHLNVSRKCAPTDYAKVQGANSSDSVQVDGKAACWWWLRSPGRDFYSVANVNRDGSIYNHGYNVSYDNGAIRPALWIDLDKVG